MRRLTKMNRAVWSMFLATVAACHATMPTSVTNSRDAGWRSDLQFLDTLVPRMHPATETDPGFVAFRASIAALSAQVPTLSDEAVGAGIQKILVAIGDGHTTIIPDDVGPISFLALKVDFYWFDDGVYVVSVRPGYGALSAARVTAIGGVPIDDVVSRIAPYVPHDNAQSARWLGAQLMQYSSILRAIGASATDAATTIDAIGANGAAITVGVPSHDRAALPRLHAPGGATAATPRYLRHNDKAYWLDSLPGDRALYVNFNSVRDDSTETLAAFAARVDEHLTSGTFRNVIVDVRLNNGGNGFLLPPLLSALDRFDAAAEGNRIFVLIGRSTFSAGQNFVTRLESTTRAFFVGEPTGGKPNHIGDHSDILLPYSGLHISVASRLYQDGGPGDTRPAIEPHLRVPVLAADYFANRDPAFDAILSEIRRK